MVLKLTPLQESTLLSINLKSSRDTVLVPTSPRKQMQFVRPTSRYVSIGGNTKVMYSGRNTKSMYSGGKHSRQSHKKP